MDIVVFQVGIVELYLNFNQINQFMSSLLKNLKIDFIFI